jgi:hypothetical protein
MVVASPTKRSSRGGSSANLPAANDNTNGNDNNDDAAWEFLRLPADKALALQADVAQRYDPKKSVWVADPESGFVAADIRSSKGDSQVVVVTRNGAEVKIKINKNNLKKNN